MGGELWWRFERGRCWCLVVAAGEIREKERRGG